MSDEKQAVIALSLSLLILSHWFAASLRAVLQILPPPRLPPAQDRRRWELSLQLRQERSSGIA